MILLPATNFLLTKLYDAGCRYVQFDGVHSVIMEDTIRLNNRVFA